MEDMDLYYWMVVSVYAIVGMYGTGYILYRFATPFMENKKETFCIVIAYFATMLILYFVPVQINTFAAYGLGILSAFAVMCRIDRRNYKQKIFIAVTFYSLDWLSEYMARIITEAIYNVETVYDNFFITGGNPGTSLLIFSGVELLDMVIGFILLGISVHITVKERNRSAPTARQFAPNGVSRHVLSGIPHIFAIQLKPICLMYHSIKTGISVGTV